MMEKDALQSLIEKRKKDTVPPIVNVNIGAKGSIADRHNNPGNLMYIGQEGAKKGEPKKGGGHWAEFDNPIEGYKAVLNDVKAKQEGKTKTGLTGESTVSEFFGKYAPPNENDTEKYISNVVKALGVDPDTPIKDIDADSLAKEIIKHESSSKVSEDALMSLINKRKERKAEEPKLSFQQQQEEPPVSFFNEVQDKYRVEPRLKNVAHATGVSEKVVDQVEKAMKGIPVIGGDRFSYDHIGTRLNAFTEMFPEMAEQAEALRQEWKASKTKPALEILESKLSELESEVSGSSNVPEDKFRGYPAAGGILATMKRRAQHPNWEKYDKEVLNNPAVKATKDLMDNTQKIKGILEMETDKEGTMAERFAKGVVGGLGEEISSMLRLPETLKNNKYINQVADKLKQLEENPDAEIDFTPEEEHLIRALSDNISAHMDLDPQRFSAYNWGYSLGSNLGFIAQFALTRGMFTATEAGVKRFLTKGVMAKAAAETIPVNMAARLAAIGVQSTYMPRFYKNWALNVSNGEPAGKAFMDAWYENFNEVFSESIYTGKLIDMASPSIYQQTLRNIGSSLAGRKGIRGFLEGAFHEYLEEKYAEIGMFAYEQGDIKKFAKDFFDLKANAFTMGSVATMTGVLGSPMIAQSVTQSMLGKMDLARLKKVIPADIRSDIDIILDNQDLSVEQAYGLIFDRMNQAVQTNAIEENVPQAIINSLRYAVAKTQNVIWDNFSTEVQNAYLDARESIRGIPAMLESDFIKKLEEKGVTVPEGKTIYDLVEDNAFFKPDKARTPEEKAHVEGVNSALKEFYIEKGEQLKDDQTKQALKEQWELQEFLEFNKERIARIEEDIEWADNRINELNQKPDKTVEEAQELKDLGTFVAENKKILTEAVNSNREFEKKLSELKTYKSATQPTGTEVVEEKSPKSETTPEAPLSEKETLTAEKAKISPKNFADLVRVGKELFGQNEVKANAAAVIMDRLIRNQAKRAGISVEEMYAKYEFQKVETKDLADIVSDPALKEQLKQGGVAASGAFIAQDGKLIISALTNPDISTPLHEMAHAFEGYLSKAERNIVLKFAGTTQWDTKTSETFARGFEKYLSEGKAPSEEIGKIFDLFRGWLIDIYNGITGSEIDIKLNAPMRKLYDSMLAEEQKKVKMPETKETKKALFQGEKQDAKEIRKSAPESRKAEGTQRQEDERIRVRQPQKDRVEATPEETEVKFQTKPTSNLSSMFPEQADPKNQKKQETLLNKLQADLDDAIKYLRTTIGKEPDAAKFIQYNGKIYSVTETKVGGKKGFSVRVMEVKDGKAKGQVVGNNAIKKNVLSASENENNVLSKEDAISRIEGYLTDYFTKEAERKIAKQITKTTPPARAKTAPEAKPISSVDDLIERIRIERNAVKDFQQFIKSIYKMIKESNDKGFITSGQFLSITNRLSGIRNDFDRKKFVDYVQEVIGEAGYRKQYRDVKSFISKLKSKLDQTGTALEDARAIANLTTEQIKAMSYEDLQTFNDIASKVDVRSTNMQVWHLKQLSNMINLIEVEQKESKEPLTIDDIRTKVNKLRDKIEGLVTDPETGETIEVDVEKNRKFIVSSLRELTRLRNLAWEMIAEHQAVVSKNKETGKISVDPKLMEIIDEIGTIVGSKIEGGKIEQELEEDKANYIDSVIDNLKSKKAQIMAVIGSLDEELKGPLMRLMTVTRADLEKLNLADVEAYDKLVLNLAHGHTTPFVGVIDGKIGRNRLKDTVLDKFFVNVKKAGKLDAWMDKISKDKGAQAKLQLEIWSKQAHRIDTWLHNFDKDHTIGSMYSYIGRGTSKESLTVAKYDSIILSAFEKFARHYSVGIQGERLHQTDSQREKMQEKLNWIGMVLAEQSYRSTDNYNEQEADESTVSIMHNNYVFSAGDIVSSPNTDPFIFERDQLHYHSLMDYLRKNNAVREVNGVEIMDTEKAELLLRGEQHVSNYMDAIQQVLAGTKAMAEWSTYSNGRTFEALENYFPFFTIRDTKPLDINRVRESLDMGRRPSKMQASATYQRTGAPHYIMINPNHAVKKHIREVAKNYHVYGEVKKVLGAIMEAGTEAKERELAAAKEAGVKNPKSNADRLARAIVTDIKLRLDKIYGVNSFTPERKLLDKALKGAKLGLLPKIHRVPAELGANTFRAVVSIGDIPMETLIHAQAHNETYKYLIQDYIGEKYMSRWGEDLRGKLFENKYLQGAENSAKWMISFADTSIGRPLFVYEMRRQFKKLSGKEFDPKEFATNLQYRVENESYIERSAARAVRKVEELFNDKSPMSSPTFIKFGYGLMKPKKVDSTFSRLFGFLMSFQRNEVNQVVDSVRRIRYSTEKGDLQQGVADITAIIFSNTLYGLSRTTFMTLVDAGYKALAEAMTGDDKEDKHLAERMESFKTWKYYRDKLLSSLAELGLGGDAAMTLWAYKLFMFFLDRTAFMPEEKEKVKQFMEQEFYVKHIPYKDFNFNSTAKAFSAGLPIPTPITEDIFKSIDQAGDVAAYMDIIFGLDIIDKEVTSKEAKNAFISLFLTGIKYSVPNAVTPNIQQAFEKDIRREAAKAKKKQGSGYSSKSNFLNMYENAGGKEVINKDTENMKKVLKALGKE